MSNITATIMVGRSSTKDGIHATHIMGLIEGEKPVWHLQETGAEETGLDGACVTWVPRADSLLEDALLMLAVYVVKNNEIAELANRYIHGAGAAPDKADLNVHIRKDNLESLHKHCRSMKLGKKLVITVMEGSSLAGHLHVLDHYDFPLELCTPQYTRRPRDMGYEYIVTGSIERASDFMHMH